MSSCPPVVLLTHTQEEIKDVKTCESEQWHPECHCYSTLASVWVYCCTWSLVCSLGNHTDNQHYPCTYWPGVFEGNDNVSIRPIPSSDIMSSAAGCLRVSAQDPCAAWPEGTWPSGEDPGLVLLEAGLEESVTLVPGRAVLPPNGLEVTAVSSLQEPVWVLEVTDLKFEHPNRTHSLSPEREEVNYMNVFSIIK